VYQDTYVLEAHVANQSLKGTESWYLKEATIKIIGGCKLWLECGGKDRSTIPILQQNRATSIDKSGSLVSNWRKRFSIAVRKFVSVRTFQPLNTLLNCHPTRFKQATHMLST
jgi:hypothetical protein